jgi:hypothetical protein
MLTSRSHELAHIFALLHTKLLSWSSHIKVLSLIGWRTVRRKAFGNWSYWWSYRTFWHLRHLIFRHLFSRGKFFLPLLCLLSNFILESHFISFLSFMNIILLHILDFILLCLLSFCISKLLKFSLFVLLEWECLFVSFIWKDWQNVFRKLLRIFTGQL